MKIEFVIPSSPADIAGVKTNWFIISVDGTGVVTGNSARCMSLLHGAVGTSVTLDLADPQRLQTNRFIIKREDVPLPDDFFRDIFGTNAPGTLATNASKPFLISH